MEKLSNLRDNLTEFRGLNRLFKKRRGGGIEDDAEERGITGGPQGGGGGVGNWKQIGSDSHQPAGVLLYATRGSQLFFLFIALFLNIALTLHQKKWDVGPSGLVAFTFFVVIQCILHSLVLLLIPIIHDRWHVMRGIARGIQHIRPSFIINGTQTVLMLIMAFVLTISSNTKGCKNVDSDPHSQLEGYAETLPSFCRNKRALTAFLWFAFFAWSVSLYFTIRTWRSSRSSGKIPAFKPPNEEEEEGKDFDASSDDGVLEGARYDSIPNRTSYDAPISIPYSDGQVGGFSVPPRQSTTYYNGERPFDDPPPSGYGQTAYEDPYERIRRERMS